MTTEQDLLNTIAAAQRQLTSLRLIPQEEPLPSNDEDVLMFRVDTDFRDHTYTYLVLRAPNGSWFATGESPRLHGTHWHVIREYFSRLAVTRWVKLAETEDDGTP